MGEVKEVGEEGPKRQYVGDSGGGSGGGSGGLEAAWDRPEAAGDPFPTPAELPPNHRAPNRTGRQHRLSS